MRGGRWGEGERCEEGHTWMCAHELVTTCTRVDAHRGAIIKYCTISSPYPKSLNQPSPKALTLTAAH